MNLTELYDQTPVDEHPNIVVTGNRVFVMTIEGTEEYARADDDELVLARSDKTGPMADLRQDVAEIKAKLGI